MRFACSTASFPADTWVRACQKAAWAEFGCVELAVGSDSLPEEDALRSRLSAENLELACLDAGEFPGGGEEEALAGLAHIGRVAALGRALDCDVVVVTAPSGGSLDEFGGRLCLLDRALGGLKAEICLRHRRETLLATPADFRTLWEAGLPDRFRPALDPAEAHAAGWGAAELRELPVTPKVVYLSDSRSGRAAPPGDGEVGLPRVLGELRDQAFAGTFVLALQGADPWEVEPRVREAREWFYYWWGS